jgi:hypothetical protein
MKFTINKYTRPIYGHFLGWFILGLKPSFSRGENVLSTWVHHINQYLFGAKYRYNL